MAWPRIPENKLRREVVKDARQVVKDARQVVKDARTAASKIGSVLDLGRQAEIDAFLKPLRHSRFGSTPVYTNLRALLEHRARQGEGPIEFVREMRKRSEHVVKEHRREVRLAGQVLRRITRGGNRHFLKADILMPLKARSISAAEAWRRLGAIAAGTYPRSAPAADAMQRQTTTGNPSAGGASSAQGSQPNPLDAYLLGELEKWSNCHPIQSIVSLLEWLGQVSNKPYIIFPNYPAPPPPKGTVAIGVAGEAAADYGAQGCVEWLIDDPGVYIGGEVSLGSGVEFAVNGNVVVEIAFCPGPQFGGPYIGFQVSIADVLGIQFEVTWSLQAPSKSIPDLWPQGIAVGVGGGEGVDVGIFCGDGKVFLLFN